LRVSALKSIILLTCFVGLIASAFGQVNPKDTSNFGLDSIAAPSSSAAADTTAPDSTLKLSTDSTYATAVKTPKSLFDFDVVYNAEDSIITSLTGNIVELYNQAIVEYGQIKMEAGYIRIEFDKSEIFARGLPDSTGEITQKPIFTDQGKQYAADEMRYNFETQKARINKVITQEGEGFLHGERIKKTDEKTFYIRNGSFTTCSHEHPHFRIITPKAKVITGEKVVTKFAYLEVMDIPTPLMVPFGFFPTTDKRKSGILIPSYGSSEFRGYFLQNGGFYWATNDYMDVTLTGDIFTQGGFGLRGNSNYKVRYKYSGNVDISYNLLRFGREEFAPFIAQAFNNSSDFAIGWRHQQDQKSNPSSRFSANVNVATSQFFKVTSINPNQVQQNRLNSSITYNKNWVGKPFRMNVTLNHSQNNQTQQLTLTLPRINFATNRFFPFKSGERVGPKKWYEEIGISYTTDAQNQITTRLDKPVFTETVFRDSSRMGMVHTIPIQANYKLFRNIVFNPGINYVERWYPSKLEYGYDTATQSVVAVDTLQGFFANREYRANANFSTKLYGLFRYKGYIRAIRHQFTPNVGLSFQPDYSDDFWGYYQRVQNERTGETELRNQFANGLSGSAGRGRQGNVNIGLQNTLEAKVRDDTDTSGLKKIRILERFSINTAYNMAAEERPWRDVSLTASSSALEGLLRLNYQGNYSFYGFNEELGQVSNQTAWDLNQQLLRTTRQTFTMGLNLNANRFGRNNRQNQENDNLDNNAKANANEPPPNLGITEGDINYYTLPGYVDFKAPWSLNLNYNLTKNTPGGRPPTINQAITANGNIDITEGWKIAFSTGYDLEAERFTITTFDFYRDLHCWEIRCSWVPVGFQQTYVLTINVKADMLQDLKLERRRGFGDL
jgi:hypothetical protein